MTDTPIYDQIRQELREHDIGESALGTGIPRARRAAAPPTTRDGSSGAAVSVWALIDEHRTQPPQDISGRRRA
ncbi:MAG: hypothetical protein M3548_12565 [Actinomycetota bacterium]|nr:hypothetical protein [Actinomycetota bacterium]